MSDLKTDMKDRREQRRKSKRRFDDPDARGPCAGCEHPIEHDEVAVSADFRFNSHGIWRNDADRQDGIYHHECLLAELFINFLGRVPVDWFDEEAFYARR